MKLAIRVAALAIALAGLVSAPYSSAATLSGTNAAFMSGPGPLSLPAPTCGPGICPTTPPPPGHLY